MSEKLGKPRRDWKRYSHNCMGCTLSREADIEQFSRCWSSEFSPLIWRIPLLLWSLTVTLWSMLSFWGPPEMFFLYMTHWGLLLIVIETSAGIIITLMKSCSRYEDTQTSLPWYIKLYWVLYNITIPVAFLISIFYWCVLKTTSKKVNYAPNPILDIMLHGVNSLAMFVELILSAHPSKLMHIMQPLWFAGAYLLFSVLYYGGGGLDPWGNIFIYPVIDWSKPDKTIVVVTLTALFLALMHLFTVGIAALRDFMVRRYTRSNGTDNKGFIESC